jgi:hypothetical protein
MKMSKRYSVPFVLGFASTLFMSANAEAINLSPASHKLEMKIIESGGKKFSLAKHLNNDGTIQLQVFDENDRIIPESQVPRISRKWISDSLQSIMDRSQNSNARFRVDIGLQKETVNDNVALIVGSGEILENTDKGQQPSFILNGKAATEQDVLAVDEENNKYVIKQQISNRKLQQQRLNDLSTRHGWFSKKEIQTAMDELDQGGNSSTITMELTRGEIMRLVNEDFDLITGIEEHVDNKDTIAEAMVSSGVNPAVLNDSTYQGNGIGIYMTETGCANSGHITNYQNLGGGRTDHSENVSAIMRAVSPQSFIYCRGGAVLPSHNDLFNNQSVQIVHVVNRSNLETATTNDYRLSDRDWDDFVYNNPVATFLAAGNNGNTTTQAVGSPAKGLNVTAVGNYDDVNNTIALTSSFGDPETKNMKPEISLPGQNITAGGHTMSGTSMASPHAAAIAADMMGKFSQFRAAPARLKALMLSAPKNISGGSDKVGIGGFDFGSAIGGWSWWWNVANNQFSTIDSTDAVPNNGTIDASKYFDASVSSVTVSLAWLNRGTYTYDHRSDIHSIGMDMDIIVYDPNGNIVGTSMSFDNPFETITFDPQMSGNYRFSISRFTNNDVNSRIDMGLVLNY